jgi:hypothetical protein
MAPELTADRACAARVSTWPSAGRRYGGISHRQHAGDDLGFEPAIGPAFEESP